MDHHFKGKLSMKKIVLAAALMAASLTAWSQTVTQVKMYGMVREVFESNNTGGVRKTQVSNDASRIGISATEDLGDGLSARAIIETNVFANSPNTSEPTKLGDRRSTVGLLSKWGAVDLGRREHSLYTSIKANDAFAGDVYGSLAKDILNFRDKRLSSSVFLNTGYGPVTAEFDRGSSGVPGPEAQSYSLGGELGPVNAVFSRYVKGNDASNLYAAHAAFFGVNFFTAHSTDNTQGVNSKGHLYGVTAPLPMMPALTLKASYGSKTGGVDAYAAGADYAFSKRTTVFVAYRKIDTNSASTDVEQYGVGLSHVF